MHGQELSHFHEQKNVRVLFLFLSRNSLEEDQSIKNVRQKLAVFWVLIFDKVIN
jgi:hypothetical protein